MAIFGTEPNHSDMLMTACSLLIEISVEYPLPQVAVATSHLYWPPSSTERSRIVRKLQGHLTNNTHTHSIRAVALQIACKV